MLLYKTGIVLNNLGLNQLSYCAIKSVNDIVNKATNIDFTLFFKNVEPPCIQPKCSIMCINELWNFNGLLITTDIDTTIKASNVITQNKIAFYIWDVEWLREGKRDYLYNLQAYRNNNVILIARSKSHKDIIENYCNRKVDLLLNSFDLSSIIGYYHE